MIAEANLCTLLRCFWLSILDKTKVYVCWPQLKVFIGHVVIRKRTAEQKLMGKCTFTWSNICVIDVGDLGLSCFYDEWLDGHQSGTCCNWLFNGLFAYYLLHMHHLFSLSKETLMLYHFPNKLNRYIFSACLKVLTILVLSDS